MIPPSRAKASAQSAAIAQSRPPPATSVRRVGPAEALDDPRQPG